MNLDILKYLGSGAKMMAILPLNLLSGNAQGDYPIRTFAAWDEEKDDILEQWSGIKITSGQNIQRHLQMRISSIFILIQFFL